VTDEQLRQLLRQADDSAPPRHAWSGDLARQVRTRARRRRRTVQSVAVAAFVLASVAGAGLRLARLQFDRQHLAKHVTPPGHVDPLPAPVSPPRPAIVVDAEALRRENTQLEAEARLHQLTAEAMLRREASAAREAGMTRANDALARRPDPVVAIAAGRGQAAQTMLRYGDRLLREPDPKAAAVAYERVLELFPSTAEAESARQRLAQLKT
jgi:hypothetical protein